MNETTGLFILRRIISKFIAIVSEEAKTLPDTDGKFINRHTHTHMHVIFIHAYNRHTHACNYTCTHYNSHYDLQFCLYGSVQ